MIGCRWPSNGSSSLTLPLGPSNAYALSTAIHPSPFGGERVAGPRQRLALTSIGLRAAIQSCCDTIGGVLAGLRCDTAFTA
jgi:hypothetical protein